MKFVFSKEKGFTLVEMVIVVSIVAVLSLVALNAINSYRKNVNDKERRTELKQIELALRLYKDSYGRYPAQGCGTPGVQWASPGPGTATWYASCDTYITGLVPSLMSSLPIDPNETKSDAGYLYITDAAGTDYKMIAHDTVETRVINKGEDMARCPASCSETYCSQNSYAVYSSGAACW